MWIYDTWNTGHWFPVLSVNKNSKNTEVYQYNLQVQSRSNTASQAGAAGAAVYTPFLIAGMFTIISAWDPQCLIN